MDIEYLRYTFQIADEIKYIKGTTTDRTRQLHELRIRMDENISIECTQKKAFEDEIQSSLNIILASDDRRRSLYQLSQDEEQQIVAVSKLINCCPVCFVVFSF